MKKIVAIALAVLMLAAMAIPAFAADITAEGSSTTTVEYKMEESYKVTIPGNVNLNIASGTAMTGTEEIKATGVKLEGGDTLTVTVTSANGSNGYELKDKADKSDNVPYTVQYTKDSTTYTLKNTPSAANETNVVLEVQTTADDELTGAVGSTTLNFSTNGTAQVGVYNDTLTFTVKIVKPSNENA